MKDFIELLCNQYPRVTEPKELDPLPNQTCAQKEMSVKTSSCHLEVKL